MNRLLITSLITAAFVAAAGPALAAGGNSGSDASSTTGNTGASGSSNSDTSSGTSGSSSNSTGAETSASSDQDIYGYEIMTPAERAEFRAKMQSAKSSQERERLQIDHQAAMQSRAKQRGITLPDDSSASQSPDSGMGSGGTP